MTYNIALTGIAADAAGRKDIVIDHDGQASLSQLEAEILKKIPALDRYLIRFSVNGELMQQDISVSPKDELLVFTPYAGG